MDLRAWLQAARPLSQANIVLPLLLGQALAPSFSWAALRWALMFGALDQLFIVFANDWADADADRQNRAPTPFSGGSRVLVDGKLLPSQLATAAIAALVGLCGLGVYLALFKGLPLMLPLVAAAAVLLWAYSFEPFRLSFRGGGELLQGLGIGVVLPLVGFYLQAGSLADFPLPVLLPTFLLGVAGNILTALPDYPADKVADKRSYPVRYGQLAGRTHLLQVVAAVSLLTHLVVPGVSWVGWLAIVVPALVLLASNIQLLGSADASQPKECLRFVVVTAAGMSWLWLAWAVASFVRGLG